MNKYEICNKSWYGEHGRQNHPLAYYCYQGIRYDSRTGQRENSPLCQDWYGRCSELKAKKK